MIIYFELLAVLFIAVLPSVLYFCMPKHRRKRNSTSISNLSLISLRYTGTAFLILYIALRQEQGLLSIGLDTNRLDLLFAGVILVSCFLLICAFIIKVFLKDKKTTSQTDWEKEVLSCRSFQQKSLFLTYVSLAAIIEELVFRGYFVLIWGQRTGYPIICAVISSIVFIALHLHRGKKAIPYYAAITIFLVIPTLYTNTIIVSIGMHLYLNVLVTVGVWIRERRKTIKKEQVGVSNVSAQSVWSPPKAIPNSKIAITLFICSWIAAPASFTLFGIPSIVIVILAIFEIIRIRKQKGQITGSGFCFAAICISAVPILLLALLFGLIYII